MKKVESVSLDLGVTEITSTVSSIRGAGKSFVPRFNVNTGGNLLERLAKEGEKTVIHTMEMRDQIFWNALFFSPENRKFATRKRGDEIIWNAGTQFQEPSS